MANVLLISEEKLKSFTSINKNVDISVIRSEIKLTQDLHLQPILGTKFYNTLLGKVSSTGNTFSTIEKTLVEDYISPYLVQKAYAELLPNLWARTMNQGVVLKDGENFGSVDIGTMKYLRNIQVQRSEFYAQRLIDWLQTGDGQNQFPDYINYTSSDGMIPSKQGYTGGIFLNRVNRKGYWKNMGNIDSYSEDDIVDKDCYDC